MSVQPSDLRCFSSQANSKDVFLEIDVENEMLKSATAPLTQLAGRRSSELGVGFEKDLKPPSSSGVQMQFPRKMQEDS